MDLVIDLDGALAELDVSLQQHEVAIRRAQRKLVRWLNRQVLRRISKETGATQKTLKNYRRAAVRIGGTRAKLWFGFNPLPLHETGRVSWSPRRPGARVRGRTYAGAFYRAVYGPQRKVWIRSARNPGYANYHPPRRDRPFSELASPGRFPVELLGAPLDQVASGLMADLDGDLAREAEQRFRTLLEQEIHFVSRVEQ